MKERIRDIGENLEIGGRANEVCPTCLGGSKQDRCLSVSRAADGILYNCYRASCRTAGFIPLGLSYKDTLQQAPKAPTTRPYEGQLHNLTDWDTGYFRERFEIRASTATAQIRLTEKDTYAIAIRNRLRQHVGWVDRVASWEGLEAPVLYTGKPRPKAMTHMAVEGPKLAWYIPPIDDTRYGDYLVVVEDQISALKCHEAGIPAVALLGTTATKEAVRELASFGATTTIIALDADATSQAFAFGCKWGLAFNCIRVAILLEHDLKDTPLGDIPFVLNL